MKDLNLFERIQKIAQDHGYNSLNDFAIKGLKYASSEKIYRLKDPAKKPSLDILMDISKNFENVSLDWLIMGKDNKPGLKKGDEMNTAHTLTEARQNYGAQTPLIALEAFAGFGSAHFRIEDKDVKARYNVPAFERIDFMMPIKGTSMAPTYNSGDIVACRIIKENQFIQWNRTFIIATKEQGIICKRLKQSESNKYLAVSDNSEYPPFEIPKEEITGLAMVVGTIKIE